MSETRKSLLEKVYAKQVLEHRKIDRACKEWIISHKAGPMYWARNFTKTKNYQWQAQGLEPVMPFPFKPYLDRYIELGLFPFPHDFGKGEPCPRCAALKREHCTPDYLDVINGYFLISKELWVPKTREMMTSWAAVEFITWHCQFYETMAWLAQSEKEDKAKGLVDYANILYRNQPDWLKELHPLRSGESEGTQHRIDWANGSWFVGVPAGERQLASHHPLGYFNDESAHQDGLERVRAIALPAVRKSIFVSSVAPGYFWDNAQPNGQPANQG